MTISLEQNKLASCPKAAEESWKRTNPEIFFLPDEEVLNFQGQSALENKNKLSPWKVCFRDFKDINSKLTQLEDVVGKEGLDVLQQEMKRLVLINITHGIADVYMSDAIKSSIEFMSTPSETTPITQNSAIALALAARIKSSTPHKIKMSISSSGNEVPLFVVLNHLNANFSQSYCNTHFLMKKNSKAELMLIEGGSAFSLFRHELELEENSSLTEFWLNNANLGINKSLYLERMVTLNENATFKDAQIFTPQENMRITSRIKLNGIKSSSDSGGVVIANSGKFDYEPIQEHCASLSKSNLSLKMILDKKVRASFQGLITAQKNAEKCEAKQDNKNILLSRNTRVDAEPRLDILPHDITCKHGSATGEIDMKQVYYLNNRLFTDAQAKNIILHSFAQSAFKLFEEENTIQKILESSLSKNMEKIYAPA